MFPRPTAEPVTARINAIRDDQWPCRDVLFAGSAAWLLSIIILVVGKESGDSHINSGD
jgi:hypothetical protein